MFFLNLLFHWRSKTENEKKGCNSSGKSIENTNKKNYCTWTVSGI